jgi:hypothetical protein
MTNIPFTPHQSKGRFLAYLRVSTPKQGEGSSLMTQREAIARLASRRGLEIIGQEKDSAPLSFSREVGRSMRCLTETDSCTMSKRRLANPPGRLRSPKYLRVLMSTRSLQVASLTSTSRLSRHTL